MAAAGDELGGCGASGRYLKDGNRAKSRLLARIARVVELGLVSWPDSRWKTTLTAGPHLSVTRKRGVGLSSAAAKGEEVRGAGCPPGPRGGPTGAGPEQGGERGKGAGRPRGKRNGPSPREEGEEEMRAAGGERRGWAKPKSGREREMSFSNFPIYVLLKYFEKKSKTNLKRKTSHTKIHAAA